MSQFLNDQHHCTADGGAKLPFSRPRDSAELPFTNEFRLLERRLHASLSD